MDELQHLIDTLPQSKIDDRTHDLYFDWTDLTKLTPGQRSVLLERLTQASHKTQQDFKQEALRSPLIQSMRKALKRFQKGMRDGKTNSA